MDKGSFLRLPEERRKELLRIAAEEFIQCGYSAASTNTITRRAGISKGILFHYFGSKKGLYLHLLSDITERMIALTEKEPEELAGDTLYDNLAALFAIKADHFNAHPLDMEFMQRAGQEASDEVRPDILRILGGLAAVMKNRRVGVALRAINRSRLRPGITHAEAMECILLAVEALDARFYAIYRGRGAEIMANPGPILEAMKLFLGVLCKGLFEV